MSDLWLAFDPADTLCLWFIQPGSSFYQQKTIEYQRRAMTKELNDLIHKNCGSVTAWQSSVDDGTEQIYLQYDHAVETFYVSTQVHNAVLFRLKPLTIFSVESNVTAHQLNPEKWFAWGETLDMASIGRRLDTSDINPPNMFFQSLSGQPLLAASKSLLDACDDTHLSLRALESRVEFALESKDIADPKRQAERWVNATLHPSTFQTNAYEERTAFSYE